MKIFLKVIKNKYLLTTIGIVVWLCFFDKNDVFTQADLIKKLNKLNSERDYYIEEIQNNRSDINELATNTKSLEKFAREKYLMKKRAALARAISNNPKYLFCDEPNSGLDPKTSIVIDNLIRDITQEFNITTIVITHDMNSVLEIGDNIMFVHEGHNWWTGTKEEILHSDNAELNDFVFASDFMQQVFKKNKSKS